MVPLLGRSVRRMTSSASSPLLDGYKVVELASVLAGPSVCQFLAEHGATVIKVENMTTAGDVTRTWRLPADRPGEDVTAYFTSCNLGKRSVALNMKDPRGRDAVHRLAASADVVVASYKPGDAQKLQVDYDTLSARNPSLVYAQLTGYGLDDHRPGYDAVIQAEAGFQFMNGAPDSAPTKMPVALMDLLAAHQVSCRSPQSALPRPHLPRPIPAISPAHCRLLPTHGRVRGSSRAVAAQGGTSGCAVEAGA